MIVLKLLNVAYLTPPKLHCFVRKLHVRSLPLVAVTQVSHSQIRNGRFEADLFGVYHVLHPRTYGY